MDIYYFCYKVNIANSYRSTEYRYIHLFRLLPFMKTPFTAYEQLPMSIIKREKANYMETKQKKNYFRSEITYIQHILLLSEA